MLLIFDFFKNQTEQCAQDDRGAYDSIHMKRLEFEHLIDSVPGYRLRFYQNDAKENTYK